MTTGSSGRRSATTTAATPISTGTPTRPARSTRSRISSRAPATRLRSGPDSTKAPTPPGALNSLDRVPTNQRTNPDQPRESSQGNPSTIRFDKPLSAPADFTFEPGDGQFVLSWAAVTADPAVSSYELRHREAGTVNWTETSAGNSLTTTLAGLTNYTTYEVMVAAKNSEGIGPYAGIAEAIPGPVSIVRAMTTGDGWAVKLTFNTPLDTAVTPTASHFSVTITALVEGVTRTRVQAPAPSGPYLWR